MRKIGSSRGAVTAYPRQLESLIRLAEAHAKMRFSVTVEIVDVEEAKRCKMSNPFEFIPKPELETVCTLYKYF